MRSKGVIRLGYHFFVGALRTPTHFFGARIIMFGDYPEGGVKRYVEKEHFETDSVIAHCVNHIIHLRWIPKGDSRGRA